MNETVETRIGGLVLENGFPTEEAVDRLYDELDFQRACQAYVWAMPAVASEAVRRGLQHDWNVDFNEVAIVDGYATPKMKLLTGNDSTIHASVFVDVERDGPVVIASPSGVQGVIDDFWQRPILELGPLGADRGKGGKLLVLPPGFHGEIPAGYLPARSLTNRAFYVGHAFMDRGDVAAGVEALARIRVYPLAQAASPPPTRVVFSGGRPVDTIAPRGFSYWELLAEVINHEPVEARDRFFHAMLRPLGIEKGRAFHPEPRQKRILTDAAQAGFLMAQALSMAPRAPDPAYPGTQWQWVLTLEPDQEAESYSQLDERADYTFAAFSVAAGMIKPMVGAGCQYMTTARDREGRWLDGGRTYRLRIPPAVPVKEHWAVTVYDNLTRSMIDTDTLKATVSSKEHPAANPDGSIDLFFGPEPTGRERNWVKTRRGRGWFAYFRWYCPTEEFFRMRWTLPDLEVLTEPPAGPAVRKGGARD